MTFLSAAQSAAVRLVGKRPATFFSGSDVFSYELCDLANEIAQDLMKSAPWQILVSLQEYAGTGDKTSYDLPSDYDRLMPGGRFFRKNWSEWQYAPANDLNQWQFLANGAPTISPGFWIILGGKIQFNPAIADGEVAQFYYVSKNIVQDKDGNPKARFTADDDSLRIDERLLTLALIWKWRENKGIPRPGDQENFDKAFAEVSGADRGANVMQIGRPRWNGDIHLAYPGVLG